MATRGWGTDHSIATVLFRDGHRFDFFQAVRLLELLQPDRVGVGAGTEPDREAVRFTSTVSQAFPATDIAAIQPPGDPDAPAAMRVNFLGLAGAQGPLPPPYTELILERAWHQDTALRDFLDVFNHRLVSLLYRARKKHYFDFAIASPASEPLAQHLFALMGLGTSGLQGRMPIADRALLRYVGLFAQQPRSLVGLETVLADYFGIQVRGEQYCGQWYALEADQVTRLGRSGQRQRLGDEAVLGTRFWDQQGKYRLVLGPLTWQQCLEFLPIGVHFDALCALTRVYAGDALACEYRLALRAAEVPGSRLGGSHGPRLGWTAWLTTRPGTHEVHVRLTPPPPSPDLHRLRMPLFAALPLQVLAEMQRRMTVHHVPKQTVVVRQGAPGTSLFVIQRGAVTVVQREASGADLQLATLQEGEVFGEIAFLTGQPRTATIITLEDTELLELPRQTFDALLATYPGLAHIADALHACSDAPGTPGQDINYINAE
jgi:type VI secretion system protein ImpH